MANSRDEIPTVPLGDILELNREAVRVDRAREYPNLGMYSFGRGLFAKPPIIGVTTSASSLYRVRAGQFIYSRLFAFEGAFGVVPHEMDGYFVSNEYPTFDVDESLALVEFLRLTICRRPTWEDLAGMTVGMGHRRQRLRPDDFLALEINLPSLDEQRAIVDICAAAERAATTARGEASAAFAALASAREELLCTDDSWEELPEGWAVTTLREVSDIRSGITKGRKARAELRPVPFIRAANVQNGYLDLTEIKTLDITNAEEARFALKPGDVLLIEGSGSVHRLGHGWIWMGEREPCVHQNHVFRVRADHEVMRPRFLVHALAASVAREHFAESAKTTSGLATINKAQTGSCPIPLPPLPAQDDIVAVLDAWRKTATTSIRAANAADDLCGSLVDELMSGGLRVRVASG